MNVRTRFAPSPTGKVHLGSVRTALFNWLFARKHNGQFIVRIDDTDRVRHQEETIQPILDSLRWLDIDWDEGPNVGGPHEPYFQSKRLDIYRTWIDRLLASGHLYRDYSTVAERWADREQAVANKVPYRFREKQYTSDQVDGRSCCIRFRVPTGRDIEVHDLVRGTVHGSTDGISDFVVAREDGSPLYSLATTIDDAIMSISHVIRSEEYLNNTFSQILLYEAMGYAPPQFAHLPYVAAKGTNRKLSKRDGGAAIEDYRDYLPDAMVNYLARLGWSLDGETELMSLPKMIDNFSLERVVSAAASHDPHKLYWFQSEWMKVLPISDKFVGVSQVLVESNLVNEPLTAYDIERIYMVVIALDNHLKMFRDVLKYAKFFFKTLSWDETAVRHRLLDPPGVHPMLVAVRDAFKDIIEQWMVDVLEDVVHNIIAKHKTNSGIVVNAIRVAATGHAVGPGLYDTLVILGPSKTIENLSTTIDKYFANTKS